MTNEDLCLEITGILLEDEQQQVNSPFQGMDCHVEEVN